MSRVVVCRGRLADGSPCTNGTSAPSGVCGLHPGQGYGNRRGPRRTYAWQKLAREVVRAWVREQGWVCPGWRRPAHPSRRLTADHVVPLARGGAALDRGNLAVLCVDCNSRKWTS